MKIHRRGQLPRIVEVDVDVMSDSDRQLTVEPPPTYASGHPMPAALRAC